jgi:ribulose 1,5-bisphosphate synthetase/thiazole synthase/HEAT repeat protein
VKNTFDVMVVGGGLAGTSCALRAARSGKQVLLVERRPALGWESTWAGQLDYRGDPGPIAQEILGTLERVGGLCATCGRTADGPAVEMALDRLFAAAGGSVLLYSYPLHLLFASETAYGVVLGSRCGEQTVRARVIVDATEEAVLWGQTNVQMVTSDPPPARYSFFMNHVLEGLQLPLDLGDGVVIHPSVWPGEVRVEYPLPECSALAARRLLPEMIRRARQVPQLAEALVSHVVNEPFPTRPMVRFETQTIAHPQIHNLLGAGIWAHGAENTPLGRIRLGEEVGVMAASRRGPEEVPDQAITGAVFEPPEVRSDILVVGGGTGGAIAAIAAAREGMQTTLIETSLSLGGIGTGGAIPSYYYGLSGGLQDEVDERIAELTPLFCAQWDVHGFHPEVKKQVLQEMAEQAGVEIHLDTVVTGVLLQEGEVRTAAEPGKEMIVHAGERRNELRGVFAASPSGLSVFEAKVFIDSTGDGDVATMAGAPFVVGREKDNICHTFSQPAGRLDPETGALRHLNFDAGYVDPTDIQDITRGRRASIQLYWQEPLTKESRVLYIAPLIGIRQGRQIVGEYQLTLADEVSGRRFDDAISFTQAHYDNHSFDYENESDQATLWVWALANWRTRIGCEVPYRCLLPQNVDRLLLASRALSMTYDAHHAFRMQKDIQRIGEVAALAAAQAVRKNLFPREIDVQELQSLLKQSGILDERYRPKPAIPERRAAELHEPGALDSDQAKDLVWLAVRKGAESLPVLREALHSSDPDVRFKASVALASRGEQAGQSALRRYVEERTDLTPEGIRTVPLWQAAIPFVGIAGDREAVPALTAVLESAAAPLDALIATVRSLGRIGDDSAIPAIQACLEREDLPTERTFRSIPDVNAAVEDARWQLELAAAEALNRLGAPANEIEALVRPYTRDDRAYVRRYAGRVLQEAGIETE